MRVRQFSVTIPRYTNHRIGLIVLVSEILFGQNDTRSFRTKIKRGWLAEY